MKKNQGFTLVELLVVVAILAILAVAGMTMLNPVELMRKSQDSGAKATASQIVSAYERSMLEDTTVATTISDTTAYPTAQAQIDYLVTTAGELKSNVQDSTLYTDSVYSVYLEFDASDELSVCFTPQSQKMKDEVGQTCGTGAEQCPVCVK